MQTTHNEILSTRHSDKLADTWIDFCVVGASLTICGRTTYYRDTAEALAELHAAELDAIRFDDGLSDDAPFTDDDIDFH